MIQVVIYDFCQTIVDFETADEFVNFIHIQENTSRMEKIEKVRNFLIRTRLLYLIEKIIRIFSETYSLNKRLILLELKGMKKNKIDKYAKDYFEEMLESHTIATVMDSINANKSNGIMVCIVSAAYDPYLKVFCEKYGIDLLVTNEFKYDKKGGFIGRINGRDCVGKEKVQRFKRAISESGNGKYDVLYSYGDSKSDKYILDIAKQGIVISRSKSKQWVSGTSYKEIVYNA